MSKKPKNEWEHSSKLKALVKRKDKASAYSMTEIVGEKEVYKQLARFSMRLSRYAIIAAKQSEMPFSDKDIAMMHEEIEKAYSAISMCAKEIGIYPSVVYETNQKLSWIKEIGDNSDKNLKSYSSNEI